MPATAVFAALLVPCLAAVLAGCGGGRAMTAAAMNASYEQALEHTFAGAAELSAAGEREALGRLEGFFTDLHAEALRERASATYAPEAYLNDTLAVVEGAEAIGEYFARTAGRVRALRVEFLNSAREGPDYFLRWRMTVESERLNGGEPMVSYGMTHFRFDSRGRVLLHKDFWDAGTGLYEYLPGLSTLVRSVRAAAEDPS